MNEHVSLQSKILLVAFIWLFLSIGITSASQIDSLEQELIKATGENRLDLLDKLSRAFSRVDLIKAEKLAMEGIELARTLQDSTTLFDFHYTLGGILNRQSRLQEAKDVVLLGLNYFKKNKNRINIGKGYFNLASIYSSKGEYFKADSLVSIALSEFTIEKDTAEMSSAYNLKGTIHYYLKDYNLSSDYYSESLKYAEAINNDTQIAYAVSNLGMIESKLGNYPLSLEYYFKALEIEKDDLSRAGSYNNISNVYRKLSDWEEALKYQKLSLEINKKIGSPIFIARSLDNLGMVYKNMLNYGDALESCQKALDIKKRIEGTGTQVEVTLNNLGNIYSRLGEFEKAIEYYQKSKKICVKDKDQNGIGRAIFNIALTKYKINNYEEATSLCLEALKIAKHMENIPRQISCNELLSEIYSSTGDHESAYKHSQVFIYLKDSIYSLDNLRKVTELENSKYQNEILAKNVDLKKEEHKKDIILQQYKWLLLGTLLLLFAGLLYYISLRGKIKRIKKQNNGKSSQEYNNANNNDSSFQVRFDQLETLLFNQQKVYSNIGGNENINIEEEKKSPITNMSEFLIDNLKTEKDWSDFERYFTKVHVGFFKTLKSKFPSITTNELNLCAFLKLNLLNNEIAEVLGINSDSVRRAQHRLAKKMNLLNVDELRSFLLKL